MRRDPRPDPLLRDFRTVFTGDPLPGPVLDLACGDGHNGIYLAQQGLDVICCDRSAEALQKAAATARASGATIETWQVDLERQGINPLPGDRFGGVLVFRYLHRPLIPCIKKSVRRDGVVMYETYTIGQPRFGLPQNPDFLLQPAELYRWFRKWHIIRHFEGECTGPPRAVAQLVCRKPATDTT
jgi:SAM-dependent methyltransferase